jgi:hypothetical protein
MSVPTARSPCRSLPVKWLLPDAFYVPPPTPPGLSAAAQVQRHLASPRARGASLLLIGAAQRQRQRWRLVYLGGVAPHARRCAGRCAGQEHHRARGSGQDDVPDIQPPCVAPPWLPSRLPHPSSQPWPCFLHSATALSAAAELSAPRLISRSVQHAGCLGLRRRHRAAWRRAPAMEGQLRGAGARLAICGHPLRRIRAVQRAAGSG